MKTAATNIDLNAARTSFKQRRFLNMPLAGLLAWTCIGVGGIFLESPLAKAWLLFIATGSIVYIAMLLSKVTGDPFFHKEKTHSINYFSTAYLWRYWCTALPLHFLCRIIAHYP